MNPRTEELREELRELYEKFLRGDIPRKRFDRLETEQSVKLYRAIAEERLTEGEEIVREHHFVRSHLKLSQSILKDPHQEATSLFLTPRRMICLYSSFLPGQLNPDIIENGIRVDEFNISDVADLHTERERRMGEAIAGCCICAFAYIFRSWLMVTGSFLFLLGFLGIVHGLLMPTRWLELELKRVAPHNIVRIYATRRKSGRLFIRTLREHMHEACNDEQGR